MNILVTGASGVLGSAVGANLIERGHKVRAVDFTTPIMDGAECVGTDTRQYEVAVEVGAGMDCVAHLGAYHGKHLPRIIGNNAESEFFDANVAGTFNMLRSAVQNGATKAVWASSNVVYERGTWRIFGIYSLTKVLGEEMCQSVLPTG